MFEYEMTSVSYTHLDVYKRQIKRWADLTSPPLERLIPLTLHMPKASPKIRAKRVVTVVRLTGLRAGRNGTGGVLIQRSWSRV